MLDSGVNDSVPTVGRFLFVVAPDRPFHVPISFFGEVVALLDAFTSMLGDDDFRTERYTGIFRDKIGNPVFDALSLFTEQLSMLLRRVIGERGILLNVFFNRLSLYRSSEYPVFRSPVEFETSAVMSSSVIKTPASSNGFVSTSVFNVVSGVSVGLDSIVSIISAAVPFELSSSVGEDCESLEV